MCGRVCVRVCTHTQALHVLGVRYVLEVRSRLDKSGYVVYEPTDLVEKISDMLKLPLPLPASIGSSTGVGTL